MDTLKVPGELNINNIFGFFKATRLSLKENKGVDIVVLLLVSADPTF